jgi:hypothetical protein
MEQQPPKTGKFALNYGLILGAISIAFSFMLYTMDMHYQGGFGILAVSALLSLVLIIIGMLQFKKANAGVMTFGQGLKIGIGMSLIAGIISIIFNLILTNVIDPDTTTKAMEYARVQLQEAGMTQEQIDAQMEMSEKFSGTGMQVAFGLIGSLFFGLILSLIPALVIKKTPSEY